MGEKGCYSIPYEIMFCDEIANLLVTGRCVSAGFEAQAAIRTTPTTAAMGQAAGLAAALSLESGIPLAEIDRKKLQKKLMEQNVVLLA